jgi:RNA polymerase sigma-70 factor, ECF subfamily
MSVLTAPTSAVFGTATRASRYTESSTTASEADVIAGLVAAAADGDRIAINELLATLQPKVVRYCRARIGRSQSTFASADDVAQEVFIGILNALPKYRSTGSGFLAFAYGIATHKIADFHRKHTREKAQLVAELPDVQDRVEGPEQHALRHELGTQLGGLLDTLPAIQREILTLRLVSGYSVDETAAAVGSTSGAVRVAQHRALCKLRKRLQADPVAED